MTLLTAENFNKEVKGSELPVFIDFTPTGADRAEWRLLLWNNCPKSLKAR